MFFPTDSGLGKTEPRFYWKKIPISIPLQGHAVLWAFVSSIGHLFARWLKGST